MSRPRLLPLLLLCLLASTPAAGLSPLDRLPLVFEANQGAFDPAVHFVARGRGYQLLVRDGGLTLLLPAGPGPRARGDHGPRTYAVQLDFVAPTGGAAPRGEQPLATRIHRLRGADPAGWHTDLPTFGAVRFPQVWPGIDLRLYDAGGELEYDLIVAPGADAGRARFRYLGADRLVHEASGALRLETPVGALHQTLPAVYEEQDGLRLPVAGAFRLDGDHSVGFAVERQDPTRPLVVDPLLLFSSYLPGSGTDWTNGLALGPEVQPTLTLAGTTTSFDLPAGAGFQPTKHSDEDVFVARLAADGTSLLWCTYLGGEGSTAGTGVDRAFDVVVDADGSALVCGTTQSDDFPVTAGAWDTTNPPGHWDGFVARLADDGASLVWASFVGNGSNPFTTKQAVHAIDLGPDGSVYLAGRSDNAGFPTTGGAFGTTVSGSPGFVLRLAADGGSVLWSGVLGATSGTADTEVDDLEVDGLGRAYVAGWTDSTSLAVTANAFDTTANGGREGFVARISEDGASLDYCSYLGSTSSECGDDQVGVACDDAGRVAFVAHTNGADYPTSPGAFQPTFVGPVGKRDAVVTVLDTEASGAASLVWSTFLGGSESESAADAAFDQQGRLHVMGWTSSSDFPQLDAVQPWVSYRKAFVSGFEADGSLVYSTFLGGQGDGSASELEGEESGRLALDALGDVYVAGDTSSADAGTVGASQPGNPGGVSGFVAKLTLRNLWVDMGLGLPGALGTPQLAATGDLTPGGQVWLTLSDGLPLATAQLVIGLTEWRTPCKGGVLVPQVDVVLGGQLLDALGGRTDAFVWPAVVPTGTTLFLQWWIQDPSGPVDHTASNALAVIAP